MGTGVTMKRLLALLMMVVLVAALAGCKPNVEVDSPEAGRGVADDGTASGNSGADLEAMPTDGPGESAAVAALPSALQEGKQMLETAGLPSPDVSGIEPAFSAYLIVVDMDGQGALFEVRADGIAHSLYAYQKAFDAATIMWTPSEYSGSPRTAPQSDPESAAVAAVEAAMRDAFPDAAMTVSVYGYRFVYSEEGTPVLTLEIATDGAVISAG